MNRKIQTSEHPAIVSAFRDNLEPVSSIASRYNVTRQAVYKILRANHVDTAHDGPLIIPCDQCGILFPKHRARVRNSIHNFCCSECYAAFITTPESRSHRQGCRIARKILEDYISSAQIKNRVVHHIDGNQDNNSIKNLMLFNSQADHASYHRFGSAIPVFDGSKLP